MSPPNFRTDPIRKNHIIAVAAVGFVVAAYTGWWFYAANAISTGISNWIASEQAKGAKISPTTVAIGGYPFAFAVKLQNATLSWPSGFGFTAQSLKVRSHPWALRTFKVNVTGGFAFNLPKGDTRPALTVAGETLKGHAGFYDNAIPTTWDLTADTVSASRTDIEGEAGRELTVATLDIQGSRPTIPPAADTDTAYDVSLQLLDFGAPSLENNPLGATIKKTALHLQLLGVAPATPDSAGLKAWRDAGGTVNAPDLLMDWGELSLGGNGTLALDGDMQPEGAFSVHIAGFEQALDSLAAAGWIKMSAASLAKLAMGIVAQKGPDGRPTVKTPLTIQNRHISLGPAKLGQLPELKLD